MHNDSTQITYVMGQLDFNLPQQASEKVTDHYSHQTSHSGYIKFWVPQDPIIINLRFSSEQDCPYQPDEHTEKQWLKEQFEQLKLYNFTQSATQQQSSCRLNQAQIDYFKTVNPEQPNATLFIHGFNVPWGNFAGQLQGRYTRTNNPKLAQAYPLFSTAIQVLYSNPPTILKPNKLSDFILTFNSNKATICRDPEHIQHWFGVSANPLNLSNDKLNGYGAHNWWLHIEYNLNCAAGFQGFNYFYNSNKPQYTRMIHIAWSGDPLNASDYMAIHPVAAITGKSLVSIILQLRSEGIAVNIIGHSAGCIVALKAMQELGKDPQHHNAIDNVFLWQAAMPSFVLSAKANILDHSINQYWHTQDAYKSAKKIHIFYSRHDNVLGPIPTDSNGNRTGRLLPKALSAGGNASNSFSAFMINTIDRLNEKTEGYALIQSAYHVAHVFGVPLSVLFSSESTRQKFYQQWQNRYQHTCKKIMLYPTLQKQQRYLQQTRPQMFNNLSLFLALYYAIMHDGILNFLRTSKNQEKLFKLIMHLTPQQASNILNATLTTINAEFNSNNSQLIIDKIRQLQHKISGSDYINRLINLFFHTNSYYVSRVVTEKTTYISHKIMDFILNAPSMLQNKLSALNENLHSYLVDSTNGNHRSDTYQLDQDIQRSEQLATIIISVLNSPGTALYPAMGYAGPLRGKEDRSMQKLIRTGKVTIVDQTDFLFHHSGMRIPSKRLLETIYRQHIFLQKDYQFGRFAK